MYLVSGTKAEVEEVESGARQPPVEKPPDLDSVPPVPELRDNTLNSKDKGPFHN